MKKLIIFLVCIFVFSGCIFGVTNEFMQLVYQLDTPIKIASWLEDNITHEIHDIPYAITPQQLYYSRKGDCDDMSGFGEYIADYHGYTTYEILIYYSDTLETHQIVVYEEERFSYMTNWTYVYGFDTFLEIVWDNDRMNPYNWETYKVFDYEGNIIERGTR